MDTPISYSLRFTPWGRMNSTDNITTWRDLPSLGSIETNYGLKSTIVLCLCQLPLYIMYKARHNLDLVTVSHQTFITIHGRSSCFMWKASS